MAENNFQGIRVSALHLANVYSEDIVFRQGYEAAFKGLPYDYTLVPQAQQTSYERGRAFAIYCKAMKLPRAVWRNGKTAKTVIKRLADAVRSRAII